jgi:hypothetical protein
MPPDQKKLENCNSSKIWLEGHNPLSTRRSYKIHLLLFCRYHNNIDPDSLIEIKPEQIRNNKYYCHKKHREHCGDILLTNSTINVLFLARITRGIIGSAIMRLNITCLYTKMLRGSTPKSIAIVVGTTLTILVTNHLNQIFTLFPNNPSIIACPAGFQQPMMQYRMREV